jgi:hypothetical protein
MKVPFCCIDSDYDDDEYYGPRGSMHSASKKDFRLAEIFSNFLNGEEGQAMLDFLNTNKKEVMLIEVFPKIKGLTSSKIILTGKGLILRLSKTDGEITDDEVSCLHACCVGGFVNKTVFKEKNLIPWLKIQFKKLKRESLLVT